MRDTLSRLYQLQVLADQLRTTNRRQLELDDLRAQNNKDYEALHKLLQQQSAGLSEAVRLKETIYREMAGGCSQISKIRQRQSQQTQKIDFRNEVMLDKRLTSSQNTLMIKFRELNQLLWKLGEPLHHPTYLHAHINGFVEICELLEIERELQLSFAGYDISAKTKKTQETVENYLQRRCLEAVPLLKKLGGVSRFNTFLNLSDSECSNLVEEGFQGIIAEDQKLLESKLTPVEDKRVIRDRVQFVQAHFEASGHSFTRLKNKTPRALDYDELLTQAGQLSYDEIKALIKPLLPFTSSGSPQAEPVITDQFDVDYAINPNGFTQIFQEKYDRLTLLRLRMNRVEELQERELRQEESKVSHKTAMQETLESQVTESDDGFKMFRKFRRILEARDNYAVAYVKRPSHKLGEEFSYEEQAFCSGCNVVIAQGLHQQVRRLNELQQCDSCDRFLVPFAHITYEKEEVDPLLISEEERIAMEERGQLGMIPACSNCGGELYEDKELKIEVTPSTLLTTRCKNCHSFLVPIDSTQDEKDENLSTSEIPEEEA